MLERPKGIEIAYPMSGERRAARYVSATTVCEEVLEHGRWIGLYWSATGHVHRENVSSGMPGLDSLKRPVHAFRLEIDGQSLHNRWTLAGTSERPGKRGTVEAVVELTHDVRPVTVRVITRLDGSPVLARYLEIVNTGSGPAALARVSPWAGVLWRTTSNRPGHPDQANPSCREGSPYSVAAFAGDDWGFEGNLEWKSLDREVLRIQRDSHGRSWSSPYAIVQNEATGERFFLGLAWSGNYTLEFRHSHESLLSFQVEPVGPAPLRVIAPGETVFSPEVHLGPLHCSLDEAVAQWHRHMRASVVPPRPKGKEMYTIAGRVVEEPGDWILREVDIAADMGAEAFMVDAGWYGNSFAEWWDHRGDWNEGEWLPGGLAGIRQYVKERDMLFGLWHESEALSKKTETYQEHPEWMLQTDDGRPCADALDLGNPGAAARFADEVLRIVKENDLDFYKLDYNVSVGEGGQNVRDGYVESEFWRHMEALQGAYDRVLAERPDICLENCAGGGGRNDLAMLSRFHYACESDWSVMPYSIRAINALSLFLPPEAICYYHNHIQHAHLVADLDTHLRVTLFGTPIFVGFGGQDADRSTLAYQKTRRYIGMHKGFCRPVLAGAPTVYHHTPDIGLFQPVRWCVLEYAAQDQSRGYAGVFKLDHGEAAYRLLLCGVDLGATYEVTLDNSGGRFRAAGYALATEGLAIQLDTALTSELVLYQRLEG